MASFLLRVKDILTGFWEISRRLKKYNEGILYLTVAGIVGEPEGIRFSKE